MKRILLLFLSVFAIIVFAQCTGTLKHNTKGKATELRIIDTLEVTAKTFIPAPIIVFDDTVRNLSIVKGNIENITFHFQNEGDSILHITNVEPSCDCMTVTSYPKSVAPHQEGDIKLKFDSKDESGAVWRTIDVTTNARKTPITLTLNIEIK